MAALAVAAAAALAQAYTSEQARGANAAVLKRIKDAFYGIVPPDYDISPNDKPDYIKAKLKDANLDFSKLTPETYSVVGTYAPEAAQYAAEANPTLVQNTAQGQAGRQAQIDALRNFTKISQGDDPAFSAKLQDASRSSQISAQGRDQAALQDAQRRGSLGSGMSFASMLQGNSDAMLGGAQAGRDAAVGSYQNQQNAIQQSGSMGRQLAQDDLGQQQTNADIINQFNQRTSKNYQQYLNNRADLSNQAQMYNLQTAQGAADKNISNANDFNKYNQTNQNALSQQQYQNHVNERNYQNQLAASNASWDAGEKERQNALKTANLNNSLQIANGKAGIGAQQIQMNNSGAADRNAAISGLAQAGGAYIANNSNQAFQADQAEKNRQNQLAMYQKYYTAQQQAN